MPLVVQVVKYLPHWICSNCFVTLVDSASVASSVQITSDGLNILNALGGKLSEFGTTVFIGLQDAEHVKIGSTGLELKDNNTVLGKFVFGGITIGDTSNTHISILRQVLIFYQAICFYLLEQLRQ